MIFNLRKFRRKLAYFTLVLSILGLITFSLFIIEESLQIITFGIWPAQDAKRWDIVAEGSDLLESTNFMMKLINYSVGWLQPLAFLSYRSYAKATDYYIKSFRAKVLAFAPEELNGRKVKFVFRPSSSNSRYLMNREMRVPKAKCPPGRVFLIEGIIDYHDSKVFIAVISCTSVGL